MLVCGCVQMCPVGLCVSVWLCTDVSGAFSAFMRLSINECQAHIVMQLTELHFQHPSLISWNPALLWSTITFLLSQCAGNSQSHFVATAIPLAELATRIDVYPALTVVKHSRHGLLKLWDFMTQAEIYTLLCVYLQSVVSQLGSSHTSLDFNIVASRRPSGVDAQLPVHSVDTGEFEQRVESALVDNLMLSPADFRRTGANEWWVMIEDIARVIEQLPVNRSVRSSVSKPTEQQKSSKSRSRGSSLVSSSTDDWATPKRKVLLATPSAVQATSSGGEMQHSSTPVPLTATSVPHTAVLKPRTERTDRRVSHGASPLLLERPFVQPQSSAVPSDKYGVSHGASPLLPEHPFVQPQLSAVPNDKYRRMISKSSPVMVSAPVVDFSMPPPGRNSASKSVAPYDVSHPSYWRSAPLQVHAAQQNLPSPAETLPIVNPAGHSSMHSGSDPVMSVLSFTPSSVPRTAPVGQMSPSVASSSPMFPYGANADVLPLTMSASFPPPRNVFRYQQPSLTPLPTLVTLPSSAGKFSRTATFSVFRASYFHACYSYLQ